MSKYTNEKIVINTTAGHNKFWAAKADPTTHTVYTRWGRLGTAGQSKPISHSSAYAAERFIENKFYEKQRKGYRDVHNGRKIDSAYFEELCIQAAIVGASNKCDELQWVELDDSGFVIRDINADRLQDPNCNPGLRTKLTTKKSYCGKNNFSLLFSANGSYRIDNGHREEIVKGHPLYELVHKVEEAIGRSFA